MNDTTTPQQQAAILADSPMTVVAAAPGAGKTRVLVARIVHRIRTGTDPRKIVAITFTNSAAREMRKRIQDKLPGQEIGHLGTLHAWGMRLISRNHRDIGLPTRPTVITEEARDELLAEIMDGTRSKTTKEKVVAVLEKGPQAINGSQVLRGAAEKAAIAFWKALRRDSLVDYDGILHYAGQIVQAHQGMMGEELLVDEFQDTGKADARIYRHAQFERKFFVGDPDQSIYGFRGSSPQIMNNLANSDQVELIGMRENFRSRPGIVDAANDLMELGQDRIPMKIEATRETGAGNEIDCTIWGPAPSQPAEAAAIAHTIRENAWKPEDTAVLVRTNHLAQVYKDALQAQGIAIKTITRPKRPRDMEEALALLAYTENPSNAANVLRFAQLKRGKDVVRDLKKKAITTHSTIDSLVYNLQEPKTRTETLSLLERRGYSDEAIEIIREAWNEGEPQSVAIQAIRNPDDITEGAGLTVATIHAAKGLEWPHVFLPALEEGILPPARRDTDLEEERRILYVGITRARDHVVLSYAKKRRPPFGNGEQPAERSRFIKDVQG